MLNIVKAMKEIDDIDISQLEKLINLAKLASMQNTDDIAPSKAKLGPVVNASQPGPAQPAKTTSVIG